MIVHARRAAALLGLAAALPLAPLAAQNAAPKPVILSPDPGERVAADQVLVAVTLPGADSVTLRVGPRDVTAEARLENGVLTWRPAAPLPAGPQRVVVATPGTEAVAWTFTVAPAQRVAAAAPGMPARGRPAAVPHGSVVFEGGGTSVTGPGAPLSRVKDVLPQMWLNATGDLGGGWRYGLKTYVSGYESPDRQPVDRFRADLRSSFLSLAVGDVNPSLHEVILDGRHVRGGQAGLRAGPFSLDFAAGRSTRAIPGALVTADPTSISRVGVYGQDLIAIRPSIGGDAFRVGLTLMHARDDFSSIPLLRTSPALPDSSTLPVNPAPRDNLVAGFDVSLRLAKGRFTARYQNAASLLNRDISDRPETKAALDSEIVAAGGRALGINPRDWEKLFILNASILPLDPRRLTNVAHQVRTTLRLGPHLISGEWRSVGTDYYSLGVPGLQRDWRGWRLRDAFSLPGDALFVTAGVEQDHDNLDGAALATTTDRAGFATLTWQAPRDITLTGSLRLGTRGNDLAAGTPGALDQSTRALTMAAQVPVAIVPSLRTRVSLNTSWVSRSDRANPVADTRDLYYLAGLEAETLDRNSSGSLMAGQDRSNFPGIAGGKTTFDRLVLAARRQLTPAWAARFDGSLLAARSPSSASATAFAPRYTRSEAMGGGEWTWRDDSTVSLTAGVVSYRDSRVPSANSNQVVARIRLARAF